MTACPTRIPAQVIRQSGCLRWSAKRQLLALHGNQKELATVGRLENISTRPLHAVLERLLKPIGFEDDHSRCRLREWTHGAAGAEG